MPRPAGDRLPELHTATTQDIAAALEALPFREREILKLRTALGDGYYYTLTETAHIFKISESRVSRIYTRAKAKFLAHISRFRPESRVEPIVVRSVLETSTKLTPFLIKHLQSHPEDLRLLHWNVFEHLVAEFFASWGYDDVRLVGRNAKTAADVFAMRKIEPDGTEIRIFVETKRWKDRVGVEVIDRVYGAFMGEKTTLGWHMAMVVTVAGFTEMNKYTSSELEMMGISLKDGNDVRQWLKDYRFSEFGLWLPDPSGPENQL